MSSRTGPVGVIGAGAVGQTVSALLVAAGWCEEILIASGSDRSAAALVTDLQDMAQIVGSPVRAQTAQPADMRDCAAVVVAPGRSSPTPRPPTSGWPVWRPTPR